MTEETETTEGKSGSRRWVGAAVVVALAIALAVVFVLPGFVAAGFSRANLIVYTSLQDQAISWPWEVANIPGAGGVDRAKARMARRFLIPANFLLMRSGMIRKFYTWEFQVAGGHGEYIQMNGDFSRGEEVPE